MKNLGLVQKFCDLRQELANQIAKDGVNPHPALNVIFSRLIDLVKTPLTQNDAAQVMQELNTPQNLPALLHLRQMCWECEMAMERDTVTKVVADLKISAAHLSKSSSTEDKIRHFERMAQRHYPHPWGGLGEASSIQRLLGLTETSHADTLFYGTSALPYSRLYWRWAAERDNRSLTMTSIDDDPISRTMGGDFLSLMENLGFVPPNTLSIVENSWLPVNNLNNFATAHVIQYPRAQQKEDIIIHLLNNGMNMVSFTYPEGLVQVLYEPIDIARVVSSASARIKSALLSSFTNTPYLSGIETQKSAHSDTLWLSTYVLER